MYFTIFDLSLVNFCAITVGIYFTYLEFSSVTEPVGQQLTLSNQKSHCACYVTRNLFYQKQNILHDFQHKFCFSLIIGILRPR